MSDHDVDQVFSTGGPKGKGKFKGKRSSGKGKGRRENPKGPDGNIMTCRTCGATDHFQKECPRAGGQRFFTVEQPTGAAEEGPFDFLNTVSVFMTTENATYTEAQPQVPTNPVSFGPPQADAMPDPWNNWMNAAQVPVEADGSADSSDPWGSWQPISPTVGSLNVGRQRVALSSMDRAANPYREPPLIPDLVGVGVPMDINQNREGARSDPMWYPNVPQTLKPAGELIPRWANMQQFSHVHGTELDNPTAERPQEAGLGLYQDRGPPTEDDHARMLRDRQVAAQAFATEPHQMQTANTYMEQDNQPMIDTMYQIQLCAAARRQQREARIARETMRKAHVLISAQEVRDAMSETRHFYDGDATICCACTFEFESR